MKINNPIIFQSKKNQQESRKWGKMWNEWVEILNWSNQAYFQLNCFILNYVNIRALNQISKISFGKINKLAIPAIISGIAEPLLSITDTAIVGNINMNPTEALAAVGIAGSFISAIVWILAQTRSAISAIIAQYYGAGKVDKILDLPAQIIVINIALSLFIYVLTIFFVENIIVY